MKHTDRGNDVVRQNERAYRHDSNTSLRKLAQKPVDDFDEYDILPSVNGDRF